MNGCLTHCGLADEFPRAPPQAPRPEIRQLQDVSDWNSLSVLVAYDAVTTYDWMRDDLTLPQGAVADQVAATELRIGPYGTR